MKPRVIGLAVLAVAILVAAGVLLAYALRPALPVAETRPEGDATARGVPAAFANTAPVQPVATNAPARPVPDAPPAQPDPAPPEPLPSPLPPPPTNERPPTETHEGDSVPPSLQPPPDLSMQVESIHRDMAALTRQFSAMMR